MISEKKVRQELKRFVGDEPILYLKHVRKEEWARDLCAGKLFMNTVKFFRELEEEQKRKCRQGDKRELYQFIKLRNGSLINNLSDEVSLKFSSAIVRIEIKGDQDVYLYCLSGLTLEDLKFVEVDDNHVKFKLPFTTKDIEKLKKDFGEYVVIVSGVEFRQRINNLIREKSMPLIFGKVTYCEPNVLGRIEAFSTFSPERFLYKDADFSHHREYRIAVHKDFVKDEGLKIDSVEGVSCIVKVDALSNYDVNLGVVRESNNGA